jgi:dephospho-CoA kinase
MSKRPYLVGISGGSASGKTSFLKALREQFSNQELCMVSQDNYYKLAYEHQKDENGHLVFTPKTLLNWKRRMGRPKNKTNIAILEKKLNGGSKKRKVSRRKKTRRS